LGWCGCFIEQTPLTRIAAGAQLGEEQGEGFGAGHGFHMQPPQVHCAIIPQKASQNAICKILFKVSQTVNQKGDRANAALRASIRANFS
jgi:hypothetical protein